MESSVLRYEEERKKKRELQVIFVIEKDEEKGRKEGVDKQVRGLCNRAENVEKLFHHILIHYRDDLGMIMVLPKHIFADGKCVQDSEGIEEDVEMG